MKDIALTRMRRLVSLWGSNRLIRHAILQWTRSASENAHLSLSSLADLPDENIETQLKTTYTATVTEDNTTSFLRYVTLALQLIPSGWPVPEIDPTIDNDIPSQVVEAMIPQEGHTVQHGGETLALGDVAERLGVFTKLMSDQASSLPRCLLE